MTAPLVGFTGPRFGPAAAARPLVAALVRSSLAAGRCVAAGCALGVDAAVVAAAMRAGAARRLSVFSAFGPSGLGRLPGSSAPLASLAAVVRAGGAVVWWAGGGPASGIVPAPPGRLVGRSLALVRALAAIPGSTLVGVVAAPPPQPFAPGGWPSCGSGTWGTLAAAAVRGLPVVVVPVGWASFTAAALPALPGPPPWETGGAWAPAASSGLWSCAWRWQPAPDCNTLCLTPGS